MKVLKAILIFALCSGLTPTLACNSFVPATFDKSLPQDFSSGSSRLLRVSPANPRYFSDASGKAIYLAGSHT
jgi:hypothetical protein